jgi:serine/threonine protein kinase
MGSRLTHTGVTATEEGRAFYQARLSIFGLCLFVLAGGSWAILAITWALTITSGVPANYSPISLSGMLHLANGLLAAALWLATRRGARSAATLHALDIGIFLGLIAIWSLAGSSIPMPGGAFISLLSFTMGTLARAIIVPSAARRTLLIGVLGGAMVVGFAAPQGSIVAMSCWTASAIALATLASHTIFGLRREARDARVLGQYTLETKIGEGGMGAVWRASHALLRRPTAIKLLPPERMGETAIRRFEREVQFTAQLTHPNSVAIYDYGRTRDGIFYYAMELLDGMDLDRLVAAHGAQPPGRVVHVLAQICGALAEAHDLGLVHGDVKPANVLLSPRKNEHEFAKIVDFGLARSVEIGSQLASVSVSSSQIITGTPLYMAPEAFTTPNEVDGRSDLYSLGALAWFMLVGRPPFEGNTVVEVCSKHLYEAPLRPSAVLGHSVSEEVENLVMACLSKKAEDRPADARALRSWAARCCAAQPWTAEHASEFWRSWVPSDASVASASRSPHTIALDVTDRVHHDGG